MTFIIGHKLKRKELWLCKSIQLWLLLGKMLKKSMYVTSIKL